MTYFEFPRRLSPTTRQSSMKKIPPTFALLLLAATLLSACSSSERTTANTPDWIGSNSNLQFDFSVPIYNDPIFLGVKVNVAFDGVAQFYLLRSDAPYSHIKSISLTVEEQAHLESLFREARFATYPEVVPSKGRVATPPSAIHMGYRAAQNRPAQSVYGAVSKYRNEGQYPDGFFDLLDGLTVFAARKLNASASGRYAAMLRVPDRRLAAGRP